MKKLSKYYQRGVELGRISEDEAKRFQEQDEQQTPADWPQSMSARPTRRRALDVKSMGATRKRQEKP